MHGDTIWKNPRGFLPGGQQPLLPFHAAVALLYGLIGGTWLLAHLVHRGALLPQQHLITVAVVLGTTEACMNYGDMASLNETGFPNHALQVRSTTGGRGMGAAYRVTPLRPARGRTAAAAHTPDILQRFPFPLLMRGELRFPRDLQSSDGGAANMRIRDFCAISFGTAVSRLHQHSCIRKDVHSSD